MANKNYPRGIHVELEFLLYTSSSSSAFAESSSFVFQFCFFVFQFCILHSKSLFRSFCVLWICVFQLRSFCILWIYIFQFRSFCILHSKSMFFFFGSMFSRSCLRICVFQIVLLLLDLVFRFFKSSSSLFFRYFLSLRNSRSTWINYYTLALELESLGLNFVTELELQRLEC